MDGKKRLGPKQQEEDDARSRMEAGGEVQWMVAPEVSFLNFFSSLGIFEACGTCGTVTLPVKATRRGVCVYV